MRTLRSGKPLPDPPPVMRGSRGAAVPGVGGGITAALMASLASPTTIPLQSQSPTQNVTASAGAPITPVHKSVAAPEAETKTNLEHLPTPLSSPLVPTLDPTPTNGVNESLQLPVKRGRGRPPKHSKMSTSPAPISTKAPLTHLPPEEKLVIGRKSLPPPFISLSLRRSLSVTAKEDQQTPPSQIMTVPKDKGEEQMETIVATTATTTSDNKDTIILSSPSEEKDDKVDVDIGLDEEKVETHKVETTLEQNVEESQQKSLPVVAVIPTTPIPTTELRRSLRCPKKKPAPIVQPTMAVERDAQPFEESCTICGEQFTKKTLFLKHCKSHLTKPPQRQPQPKAKAEVKVELPTSPTRQSTSSDTMMVMDQDDGYANGDDYDDDDEKEDLEQQYQKYAEGERSVEFKPPIIDFTKKRPSQSSLAMKDPVTCTVCTMTFTRRAHLNRHMLLHTGIKPFTCDICKLKFTRKDHMFAHKMKHETQHNIQCAQCGEGFVSWRILQDHIKDVHSVFKPATPGRPKSMVYNANPDNACDTCGKKFLQRRYLRAHRKLHLRREASIIEQLRMVEQDQFGHGESYEGMGHMYGDDDMDMDDNDMDIDENMLNPEVQIDDGESHDEYQMKIKTEAKSPSQDNEGNDSSHNRQGVPMRKSLASLNRVVKLAEKSSSGSDAGSFNSSVVSVEDANLDKDELDDLIDYDYKAMMQLKSENFADDDFGDDDSEFQKEGMECSVCGKIFTERSELRKHYRLHKKRFICRFCGLKLASAGSLMRHNLIHTGKKEFGCKLCSRRFSRKDTLMVHLQAHEKSSTRINMPKPYLCRACGAGYTMKYNLIRHIKMCHGSMTSATRAAILKQIEQKYKDGIPSTSPDESWLDQILDQNQYGSEPENGMKIKNEPLDAVDEDDVEGDIERMTSSPTDEELMQCQQDELQQLSTDDNVVDDQAEDSENGQFVCNHCGKIFKNAKSLNTHKWYHGRDKQFICPICNRGFKYSTDLGRHVTTHGSDSPNKGINVVSLLAVNGHQLPGSSQTMNDSSPLNQGMASVQQGPHSNVQTGGRQINSLDTRPFGCKLCPQRFNHRSNLSRHVRQLHKATNPRQRSPSVNLQNYLNKLQPNGNNSNVQLPAQIEVRKVQHVAQQGLEQTGAIASGSRSSWNGNLGVGLPKQLELDRRRSSGGSSVLTPDSFTFDPTSDRPYICNSCGKSFESKSNLWTHSRIHNKIFGCEYCGLKMATRGDLILHLRTHTGEKPFGCHLCEWKFSRKSGLNKHMEKYHGPNACKQLRAFKYGQTQVVQSPQQQPPNQQIIRSGMEISTIQRMPGVSANYIPPQRSELGVFKSVLHKNGSGLTITRKPLLAIKFTCPVCKTFMYGKANYVDHLNSHLKSKKQVVEAVEDDKNDASLKQFVCKECGQGYDTQGLLTKHILTHSDSDSPRCTLCGKSCSSLGFLKRHYQYVHPDAPNPADTTSAHLLNGVQIKEEEKADAGVDLKPVVVRKIIKGENGEEESDEEFPNESDDPPNTVKPGSKPFTDIDANDLDEDQIEYAVVNPRKVFDILPPCERCGKEFTNKKARADHVWYCKRTKRYRCPVAECGREFKLKHDVTRHLRRHTNERRFQCRICTARFLHKIDSHRHMKLIHNFSVKSRANPCDFCDQHYATDSELNTHLQSLHGVDFNDVFNDNSDDDDSPEQLDEEEYHHQLSGADDDEIPDPTSFLEQSMGVNDQEYHCSLCNKYFPTRQKWLYHRYYHIREEKYDCQECDEKFKLRSHLERHIRTYHNVEKPVYNILTCPECPRKFTREYDLSTHVQKIHLQIPRTIQNQRLSVPAMTATVKNPASILKPPAASATKPSTSTASSVYRVIPKVGNLVRKSWPPVAPPHPSKPIAAASTPTNASAVKPKAYNMMRLGPNGWYTCNLCGKSFKEKKSIDAHRYYHNREEKHFCEHCGARFKQKSDLHRHIRIHHNSMNPKNTIHCPKCYRSFTDIRYMRMHMRRNHGEGQEQGKGKNEALIAIAKQGSGQKGNIDGMDVGDADQGMPNAEEGNGDEMEWDNSPEVDLLEEDEDEDQKEMMTMEEMEYLQYQNSTENGDGLQLTISCESCGVEVDSGDIAEHVCASDSQNLVSPAEKNKSVETEPDSPAAESSAPRRNDKKVEEPEKTAMETSQSIEKPPESVESPESTVEKPPDSKKSVGSPSSETIIAVAVEKSPESVQTPESDPADKSSDTIDTPEPETYNQTTMEIPEK